VVPQGPFHGAIGWTGLPWQATLPVGNRAAGGRDGPAYAFRPSDALPGVAVFVALPACHGQCSVDGDTLAVFDIRSGLTAHPCHGGAVAIEPALVV
jgi:hypothetical protein